MVLLVLPRALCALQGPRLARALPLLACALAAAWVRTPCHKGKGVQHALPTPFSHY